VGEGVETLLVEYRIHPSRMQAVAVARRTAGKAVVLARGPKACAGPSSFLPGNRVDSDKRGIAPVPPHRGFALWAGFPVQRQSELLRRRMLPAMAGVRAMTMSAVDLDKKMGEVNALFVEARELIADALDSQGSTYFEDDLDDAQHAVKECVEMYEDMLGGLSAEDKGKVMRMMGMKIEQLKGELQVILDSLLHDEELPTSDRKEDA
jgi:hypothetical protein